jgi:hypothetical protein
MWNREKTVVELLRYIEEHIVNDKDEDDEVTYDALEIAVATLDLESEVYGDEDIIKDVLYNMAGLCDYWLSIFPDEFSSDTRKRLQRISAQRRVIRTAKP